MSHSVSISSCFGEGFANLPKRNCFEPPVFAQNISNKVHAIEFYNDLRHTFLDEFRTNTTNYRPDRMGRCAHELRRAFGSFPRQIRQTVCQ